jgi:hypothetical protein
MSLKVKKEKVKLQFSGENFTEYVAERFDEFVRIAIVGASLVFAPAKAAPAD